MLLLSTRLLVETLPPERRSTSGLRTTLRTVGVLLRDRPFVLHGLANGLALGARFSYRSGSSFVLQEVYGLSPQAPPRPWSGPAATPRRRRRPS